MRPVRYTGGRAVKRIGLIGWLVITLAILLLLALCYFLFPFWSPAEKPASKYFPLDSKTSLLEASRGTDTIYREAFANSPFTVFVPAPLPANPKIHPSELVSVYQKDDSKIAYLTFDDGPTPSVTPRILDILKQYNVKATFFVIGALAEKNPGIIKRAAEEGHLVANHSYSHNYNKVYESQESFKEELIKCEDIIKTAIGEQNYKKLFRFPGGSFEERKKPFKDTLRKNGYKYIDWNALSGDSETKTPTKSFILNNIKNTTYGRNKVVILMHDAGAKRITADTLPEVIEFLKSKGYEFRTLL